MATILVTPREFAQDIGRRSRALKPLIMRSIQRSAERGRARLVRATPVDQGQMRNAWRVIKKRRGADLVNDAPHAGVIEGGARPHNVSYAGRRSIERWVMRQLGVTDEKIAIAIAEKIVWKLQKYGQKGHFMARDALPHLRDFVQAEAERLLKAQAGKRYTK